MSTICEAASTSGGDALDGARHGEAEGAGRVAVTGLPGVRWCASSGGTAARTMRSPALIRRTTGVPGPTRAPASAKRSATWPVEGGADVVAPQARLQLPDLRPLLGGARARHLQRRARGLGLQQSIGQILLGEEVGVLCPPVVARLRFGHLVGGPALVGLVAPQGGTGHLQILGGDAGIERGEAVAALHPVTDRDVDGLETPRRVRRHVDRLPRHHHAEPPLALGLRGWRGAPASTQLRRWSLRFGDGGRPAVAAGGEQEEEDGDRGESAHGNILAPQATTMSEA